MGEGMSNVITNVDLSQAELRCMAIFSGDQWIIDALQEGQGDFFNNHMMPVCFPWIEEEWGDVETYQKSRPTEHKENRTKVKGVQYGLAFGRSAPAIARALNMSNVEAKSIISNYFLTARSFASWRIAVMEAAVNPAKRDLLVSPTGRRFQSEMITGKNMNSVQREALSFLPQSTSSDICLMSAMQIHQILFDNGYKTRIINVVHDAIMFEGPEGESDEVGRLCGRIMRETGAALMGDAVPFLSDYSSSVTWSDLS